MIVTPTKSLACIITLALAAALAGCGNGDASSTKARANAPLQTPKSQLQGGEAKGDVDEALKERLARQEAASKLFERARPEPAPAKPEPAKPEPKPEPVKTAAATPPPAPPRAEPKPEPAPPPVLAAAKPAAAPPPPAIAPAKLLTRVDPEFPREAIQAGAETGSVRARMTLDGSGNVTRVEVVEANPRRLFDRAVVRSLSQWRFNEGPSGRTVETEVEFKRASKWD